MSSHYPHSALLLEAGWSDDALCQHVGGPGDVVVGEHEAPRLPAAVADHAALVDRHPGHPLGQPGVGERLAPGEHYWSVYLELSPAVP